MNNRSDSSLLPPIREVFLSCADVSYILVSDSKVGESWNQASICRGFSVGGLAVHLTRGYSQVEVYLGGDEPQGAPVSAGEYYNTFPGLDNLNSEISKEIVAKSEEIAREGWEDFVARAGESLNNLGRMLGDEPSGRLVKVAGDAIMTLDQYLLTRIVELTVHVDDLAESVSLDSPPLSPDALVLAIGTLVQSASVRYGSRAVLRALARPELDKNNTLKIF